MHLLLVYWHFLKSVSVGARINKDPSGTFSFMDEESKQSETSFSAWYPEDCWLIILDGTAYLGGLGRTWPSYYFWLQPIQLGRLCHTVSGPLHMSLILSISFQFLLLELWFPCLNLPFLHYTICMGISLHWRPSYTNAFSNGKFCRRAVFVSSLGQDFSPNLEALTSVLFKKLPVVSKQTHFSPLPDPLN